MVVATYQPKNIEGYDCKKDQVKLIICLFDKSTGQFNGLRLQLAYIVLRGDLEE